MFNFSQNYLTRGFWGDEAWTSLISQLPYLQMLKTTAADFHPPGYYTVVEFVYKILPHNEIGTRMISILFWWLTVWMVFLLARKLNGVTFGLIAALIVAVNPVFFTYAFEARNYTMFAFVATGSIYALIQLSTLALKKESPFKGDSLIRWQVIFVFFSTLGIYTHYYMFFVLASQGLFVMLFSAKGGPSFGWDRKIFLKMFMPWIAIFILYIPWIPYLIGQLTSVNNSYWIGGIDKNTHFEAILRILSGENQNPFRIWLFGVSVLMILTGVIYEIRKRLFGRPYFLIWFWAIAPFILASLPGLKIGDFRLPFRPIFFWRYLIVTAIPFSILIVYGTQRLGRLLFKTSIVVVVFLSAAIDLLTWISFPKTFKQIYGEDIVSRIKQEDKIVTSLPSFAEVLYYRNYFGLTNDLIVLPEGLVQSSGKSLLDAYVANGVVTIGKRPAAGRYFELMRDNSNIPKVKTVNGE